MQYFTALEISKVLNGEIVGDPNVKVNQLAKIEEGTPGALSFLSNPKYTHYIYETKSSIVLVNHDFEPEAPVAATMIKVSNSYEAIGKIMQMVQTATPRKTGIEPMSYVSPKAKLGENVYVAAFAYISDNAVIGNNVSIYPHVWIGDDVVVGDDTTIFSGVKLYPDTKIGSRCIIHAGVVVGADGFGFVPLENGTYEKLPQMGNVVVEDDVELGANTTIDCATMGSTMIGKGVKLDNQVQIGHNARIGENTVMAALTGIAGSTVIGKHCTFAGQVGVAGHLKVGDNVMVSAKSGVVNNVSDNSVQMGFYSFEGSKFRRAYALYRNLPDLVNDVRQLKKEIEALKKDQK